MSKTLRYACIAALMALTSTQSAEAYTWHDTIGVTSMCMFLDEMAEDDMTAWRRTIIATFFGVRNPKPVRALPGQLERYGECPPLPQQ
ncbi:MAG: hypothetical protein HUU22_02180 [Phycisphaerae bacterium]|nr:hypothetical protein [Phycisphaerae bacterium]NUQ44823.1 hypothetical protein [Phycisphaerae bacterium]